MFKWFWTISSLGAPGQRAGSKKITSPRWVDTWARDMVMWYWSVTILFWQLSIDHIVNVQYNRCGFDKTRLRHPSLPFDSLPFTTRTICRRVRTLGQSVTTKRKEVDHILWVWSPAIKKMPQRILGDFFIIITIYFYNYIFFKSWIKFLSFIIN